MPIFKTSFSLNVTLAAVALCSVHLLNGCAAGTLAEPDATGTTVLTIRGNVHGGQNPVGGSTVQLWETGTTGYGSGAAQLVASTTTSAGTGAFSFPTSNVSANCVGGPTAYITATGGDPSGSTTNNVNTGLLLAAVIGPCSTTGASTTIVLNEVTTVAAAYALSGFATDRNGTVNIGAPASNAQGLADAVANAGLLASNITGNAAASTASIVLPTVTLNSLANALAACVNTASTATSLSSACANFYSYTTPPGGTAPADTFQAALNMAKFPGNNVAQVLSLGSASAPFVPSLGATTVTSTTSPNDLTLGIAYPNAPFAVIGQTGATISIQSGAGLAIDSKDNIWVTGVYNGTTASTYNYITELTSASATPSYSNTLASTAALDGTHTIRNAAFDTLGNFWLTDKNSTGGSVIEIAAGASPSAASEQTAFSTALDPNDWMLAIDASNNIWTASYGAQGNCTTATSGTECAYVEYVKGGTSSSPTYTPTSSFGTPAALATTPTVRGIAVDSVSTSSGLGNVWTANYGVFGGATTAGTSVEVLTPSASTSSTSNVATITLGSTAAAPLGVALDASGNGYVTTGATVATSGLYLVPQGTGTSTISSTVSTTGNAPTSGAATLANIANAKSSAPASSATAPLAIGGLSGPGYAAVDGAGNVFVANYTYGSVVEYSPSLKGYVSPYYGFAPSLTLPAETVAVPNVTLVAGTNNVNGTANIYYTANNAVAGETVTFSGFTGAYAFLNTGTYTITSIGSANYFIINSGQSGATVAKTATSGSAAISGGSSQAVFTCGTTCSIAGNPNSKNNSIAIDRAGTVWTLSGASATLYSIIGTAAPTDPILADGKSGVQP